MIAIIDYDAGNTFNVQKAFAHLGIPTVLTADKTTILQAAGVVVPGVGAFRQAMDTLTRRDLVPVLETVVARNIPVLAYAWECNFCLIVPMNTAKHRASVLFRVR